jgi:hypothetical protein
MFPFANISSTDLGNVFPRFQYVQRIKQSKPEATHLVVSTVKIKNSVLPEVRNVPMGVSPVWDKRYRN